MIHVDRSSIKKPGFFSSRQYSQLQADLAEQLARDEKQKKQARYKFDFALLKESLASNLLSLFNNKCAYCEDGIDESNFALDHFRPVSLYPWLAYEWENLYPVCHACNRNKGHQFPVSEGSKHAESVSDLAKEKPLLLDPCNSRPKKHLSYTRQGLVQGDDESGETTVKILGLNRSELQKKRSIRAREVQEKLDEMTSRKGPGTFSTKVAKALQKAVSPGAFSIKVAKALQKAVSPGASFAGMSRQILAVHLLENPEFEKRLREKVPAIETFLEDAIQARGQRVSRVRKASTAKKAASKKAAGKKSVRKKAPSKKAPSKKAASKKAPSKKAASKKASGKKAPGKKAARSGGAKPGAPGTKKSASRAPESAAATSVDRKEQLDSEVDALPVTNASIQSIHITNFKAIHDLRLNPVLYPEEPILEREEDEATLTDISGWMTLLGENGSGKSSLLQAIALALAGKELLDRAKLDPQAFLMRGKRSATVELELTNGTPIVLKVTRTRFTFESGAQPHGVFVRAYGSTRLLPVEKSAREAAGKTSRVQFLNMFDPFQPLIDADRWLAELSDSDFRPARLAIKDLLGLDDDQEVEKKAGEILVDGQPLSNLSAGYQTIIALACDIMAGVPHVLDDMQQAQGIVLIDEIGSHLHPQWKMRIVPRLRKAFPLIQFLVSSHDPLCLRGHSRGEVMLVTRAPAAESAAGRKKSAQRIVSVDGDLPSPRNLRVDQLLTSRHFGMDSTIDPQIDDKFGEYYQLLALKEDLQPAQIERRDRLAAELQQHGVLGYTRRDQLVYEAIDEYLAQEPSFRAPGDDDAARKARRSKVKKRIRELWRYANAFEPGNGP